jgi:hypothetical protein
MPREHLAHAPETHRMSRRPGKEEDKRRGFGSPGKQRPKGCETEASRCTHASGERDDLRTGRHGVKWRCSTRASRLILLANLRIEVPEASRVLSYRDQRPRGGEHPEPSQITIHTATLRLLGERAPALSARPRGSTTARSADTTSAGDAAIPTPLSRRHSGTRVTVSRRRSITFASVSSAPQP